MTFSLQISALVAKKSIPGVPSPRNGSPDGEGQMHGIQYGPAVKPGPQIEAEPRDVTHRPEIEAPDVLPNIQRRPGQAENGYRPGECGNHENSPSLHIAAKRGRSSRNSRMSSSGLTESR